MVRARPCRRDRPRARVLPCLLRPRRRPLGAQALARRRPHPQQLGPSQRLQMILETTVVGSYPQPNWLIDRAKLGSKVPRVRAPEIWKVEDQYLEEAQDDATLIAIRDMERAGIDIIT